MNAKSESGSRPPHTRRHGDDLRGVGRLAIDAVHGVTDVVEAMHRNISGRALPVGKPLSGPTAGIAGLVYKSVRGVTRLVGQGVDAALTAATPLLGQSQPAPLHAAVVAALNGVYGDHLERSGNPLAQSMQLVWRDHTLDLSQPAPAELGPHPLILIHGLCMTDRQWLRQGHDHGAALAREFGYTPIYLRYNSGRHVADNGRELALMLQQLMQQWPGPVESLTLLGHSMGGLVARSAVHHAQIENLAWVKQLSSMVFLGTPHHGAPLERAGNWFETAMGVSPYSAPLMRLGESRSAGIKDLRFGHVTDAQPRGRQRRDTRRPVPLPEGVRAHAIAATRGRAGVDLAKLPSDGLVPIESALGVHHNPDLSLAISPSHQWLAHECSHFDLLSRADVYARLREWLAMAAVS